MNNPFFDLARDGCMKAQREMATASLTCLYIGPGEHADGERAGPDRQDLIARRSRASRCQPVERACHGAAPSKPPRPPAFPTITWDSDLLPADAQCRATPIIGTHNYDIGVNLAKIAQQLKPNGGRICIQTGGAAAANHNERMQGIRDTLSGCDRHAAARHPHHRRTAGRS